MIRKYTKEDLIKFEDEIAYCFENKTIRSVIHLSCNNENQLIEIFSHINDDDYIFCSWRSHYHVLLKGVPWDVLKKDIIDGRSMALCYPQYKIFSSSIVGGIIPISNGTALDIKRKKMSNHVWCFIGDMTSESGCFHENYKYATNFGLPITYVIENNGKSVCTDTYAAWNTNKLSYEPEKINDKIIKVSSNLWYYWYNLDKYSHAGTGKRIQF